jgi:cytidylate kinase
VIVAIDGPAAAGKGTVARALAARLGWTYVDTGAMYRAVAFAASARGARLDDEAAVAEVARAARVELVGERVNLDGVDVTDRVRAPEVNRVVSSVAAYPSVRAILVEAQQAALARGRDVVIEGRDIGTTVAPDADVKVFLTASIEERARRRVEQLGLDTDDATLESVRADLAARDRADATRAASPFRKAGDAVEIDSTGRSVDEIVGDLVGLVARAREERA